MTIDTDKNKMTHQLTQFLLMTLTHSHINKLAFVSLAHSLNDEATVEWKWLMAWYERGGKEENMTLFSHKAWWQNTMGWRCCRCVCVWGGGAELSENSGCQPVNSQLFLSCLLSWLLHDQRSGGTACVKTMCEPQSRTTGESTSRSYEVWSTGESTSRSYEIWSRSVRRKTEGPGEGGGLEGKVLNCFPELFLGLSQELKWKVDFPVYSVQD